MEQKARRSRPQKFIPTEADPELTVRLRKSETREVSIFPPVAGTDDCGEFTQAEVTEREPLDPVDIGKIVCVK